MVQEGTTDGIPDLRITFPDGHEDRLVLHRFYASKEEELSRSLNCNFLGHLENEGAACVAVTGCPGQDKLQLTINSMHNDVSNMYVLHENGEVEVIEVNKDSKVNGMRADGELDDTNEAQHILDIEEECAMNGNCNAMPPAQLLRLKVVFF